MKKNAFSSMGFFLFVFLFLIIFSIFGLYAGYSEQVNAPVAGLAIFVSVAGSLLILFFTRHKIIHMKFFPSLSPKSKIAFFLILIIFSGILLYTFVPEGIFNSTCSDLMNHARAVRLVGDLGSFAAREPLGGGIGNDNFMDFTGIPLLYKHGVQQAFYGVGSLLYALMGNAYVIVSMLGLLFLLLCVITVFLIARHFFDERTALLAMVIGAFSLSNWWFLEAGFLPQLMGSFFLLASFYFILKKNNFLVLLANIGIFSFYPYLAIYLLFLVLMAFLKGKFAALKLLSIFILAALIIWPETIGALWLVVTTAAMYSSIFLIRGGISTPNFFSLVLFFFSIPILALFIFKKRFRELSELFAFIFSIFIFIVLIGIFFAANYFLKFGRPTQIHQLYLAVKAFYFLLFPLSILAGAGFFLCLHHAQKIFKTKKIIFVLAALVLISIFYFVGYAFIIKEKTAYPPGFYTLAEELDQWPGEFSISVDSCFLESPKIQNPFWYSSLFDNPDISGASCREIQLGRAFQFHWASHGSGAKGQRFMVLDSNRQEVIRVDDFNANYFLTNCSDLNFPVVLQENDIRVYQLH